MYYTVHEHVIAIGHVHIVALFVSSCNYCIFHFDPCISKSYRNITWLETDGSTKELVNDYDSRTSAMLTKCSKLFFFLPRKRVRPRHVGMCFSKGDNSASVMFILHLHSFASWWYATAAYCFCVLWVRSFPLYISGTVYFMLRIQACIESDFHVPSDGVSRSMAPEDHSSQDKSIGWLWITSLAISGFYFLHRFSVWVMGTWDTDSQVAMETSRHCLRQIDLTLVFTLGIF